MSFKVAIPEALKPAGAALAALFATASFAPVPPSLDAAPTYLPYIWNNGLDLQVLNGIYQQNAPFARRLAEKVWQTDAAQISRLFPRKSHAGADMILELANAMNQQEMAAIPTATLAAAYGLDARELHRFRQVLLSLPAKPGPMLGSNCYAYAVNDYDRGVQDGNPGERTLGHAFSQQVDTLNPDTYGAYVRHIIRGAESDGLVFTGREMREVAGMYHVALYIRKAVPDSKPFMQDGALTGHEYHWARQNKGGGWSHKYGQSFVTNVDYGGHVITNAAKADMAGYRFIGYFNVPEGGLDVGAENERATKPGSRTDYATKQHIAAIVARAP